MFLQSKMLVVFAVVLLSSVSFAGKLPDYIQVCKRDPYTVSDCVKNAIETLRPRLAEGIPELKVPGIEPLIIPEIVIDQGNVVLFKAVGRDVKVYGASNFKLKSLEVDLDQLQIKAKIYLPRLQFEGKYDLDARLLVIPIHGKGDLLANATKCYADVVIQAAIENKNGVDYLKFTGVSMNIDVTDYSMRLTNLFNGDESLGAVANEAINANKAEFLRASKPYVERTTANLFKKIANKIVKGYTYDEILPLP